MATAIPKKMSHYPSGFKHGITVKGVPLVATHTGEVFWVDENASSPSNTKGTWQNPCNSIDNAMSLCVANRHDVIMVKPGHIENITGASTLTCDIAGVAIVGMGRGTSQAKLRWDAADSTVVVSADNVTFSNLHMLANKASIVNGIVVNADFCTIENCVIRDGSATLEFLDFILLAADSDYFSFIGNDARMWTGSSTNSLIKSTGDTFQLFIADNFLQVHAEVAVINVGTSDTTGYPIFMNNVIQNWDASTGACLDLTATTTAVLVNERYISAKDNCFGVVAADLAASWIMGCLATDIVKVASRRFPTTTAAF